MKFCLSASKGHVSVNVQGVCVCMHAACLLWQPFLFAFECLEGGARDEKGYDRKKDLKKKRARDWSGDLVGVKAGIDCLK